MYCLLAAFYRQDEDALLSTKTPEDKTVTMWYKCKKNCGLYTSLRRMTHLKLQKLQKGDYPPAHRLSVNVLLSNNNNNNNNNAIGGLHCQGNL